MGCGTSGSKWGRKEVFRMTLSLKAEAEMKVGKGKRFYHKEQRVIENRSLCLVFRASALELSQR